VLQPAACAACWREVRCLLLLRGWLLPLPWALLRLACAAGVRGGRLGGLQAVVRGRAEGLRRARGCARAVVCRRALARWSAGGWRVRWKLAWAEGLQRSVAGGSAGAVVNGVDCRRCWRVQARGRRTLQSRVNGACKRQAREEACSVVLICRRA
jgi:hypothetical protein